MLLNGECPGRHEPTTTPNAEARSEMTPRASSCLFFPLSPPSCLLQYLLFRAAATVAALDRRKLLIRPGLASGPAVPSGRWPPKLPRSFSANGFRHGAAPHSARGPSGVNVNDECRGRVYARE